MALALIDARRAPFLALLNNATSSAAAKAGIKHLDYLTSQWMSLTMWRSWSDWGRLAASTVMGVTVEGVVPTTNHLESFNAILKRKHLPGWLHSGHQLQFDSLIHILITRILPGIFDNRRAQKEYADWLVTRFSAHSGGTNLAELHKQQKRNKKQLSEILCWWQVDEKRDDHAKRIVELGRITVVHGPDVLNSYQAVCASSKSDINNPNHVHYTANIHRSGFASCTCIDYSHNRGLACKHLRALRLLIDGWIHSCMEGRYTYPQSMSHAQEISQSIEVPSPVPPTPAQVIDWTAIQALGNDSTTLDDQENHDNASAGYESSNINVSDSEEGDAQIKPATPVQTVQLVRHTALSGQPILIATT